MEVGNAVSKKMQLNRHKENGSFENVFTVPIIDRIETEF